MRLSKLTVLAVVSGPSTGLWAFVVPEDLIFSSRTSSSSSASALAMADFGAGDFNFSPKALSFSAKPGQSSSGRPSVTNTPKTPSMIQLEKEIARAEAERVQLLGEIGKAESALEAKQIRLERLAQQKPFPGIGEIGGTAASFLAPVAALGAGRAYLQKREQVQAEIAAAEAELEAKRRAYQEAEIRSNFGGVSISIY